VEEGEHISTAVTYWELIYTEKLARSYRYSIHFILMRKRIECDECWFILVRDNGNWRKEGGAKEISQPRSASRLAPIRKRPPQLQSSFSLSLYTPINQIDDLLNLQVWIHFGSSVGRALRGHHRTAHDTNFPGPCCLPPQDPDDLVQRSQCAGNFWILEKSGHAFLFGDFRRS
jgi:hypothetical protein